MIELTARELLTHLFYTAINAVDGRQLVQHWCRDNTFSFTHCIAIGKAAPAMLQGALDCQRTLQSALLISIKENIPRALHKDKRINVQASSHPVPDQSSFDAGTALLSYVESIPADSNVLVLISGGTSSLVEVPVDGYTLEQIQQVNEHLLASGMDIHAMNAWRKCFSQIKGGGLLSFTQHLNITQLILSDVKGNDPAVIGSGLLVQSDRNEVVEDGWLETMLNKHEANKAESIQHVYMPVDTFVIGNNELAVQAAVKEAQSHGLDSYYHETFVDGDAIEQGRAIGQWLVDAPAGVHVWGGETTLELPENPGVGGRNQSMALAMATTIAGQNDLVVLVAGTDGIDGNTSCAGAIVTGDSMRKSAQMGFNIDDELGKANAGTVLMATDELLKTGPTNTNVMDIIIAYKRI